MAPLVEPVHWLVVRGPNGVLARRWASQGEYNGQSAAGAVLLPGDRLTLGSVELELLDSPATAEPLTTADPPGAANEPPSSTRPHVPTGKAPPVAAIGNGLTADTDEARSGDHSVEGRLSNTRSGVVRKLRRRLRSFRRRAVGRIRSIEAQLQEARAELEAQRRRAADLDRRSQAEVAEIRQQLGALVVARDRIDTLAQELEEQRSRFEEQKQVWESTARQQQEELRRQKAEIEQQLAELRQAQQELAKRPATPFDEAVTGPDAAGSKPQEGNGALGGLVLDHARGGTAGFFEDALARRSQTPKDADGLGPEHTGEAAERQLSAVPTDLSEPEEAEPVSLEESPPASAESVLRRLGIMPQFDDEPSDEATSSAHPSGSARRPEAVPPQLASLLGVRADTSAQERAAGTADAVEQDGDDSIEQYMAKLLERVKQTSRDQLDSAAQQGPKTPVGPPAPEEEPSSQPGQGEPTETSDHDQSLEQPLGKLNPRAVAPEKSADLQAMRRLANLSAEKALSNFARRKLHATRRSKLTVAFVAAASGATLFWINFRWPGNPAAAYGAVLGLVIAVLWGLQYTVLAGKLLIGRSNRRAASASDQAAERPSPLQAAAIPDDASAEVSPRDDADEGIVLFNPAHASD